MNWFESEKSKFYKKEKKSLFSGKPKKDGSGLGMRLNKGRGGCPPSKQKLIGQGMEDFSPERVMKLTGGMVITAGGILAGTKLIQAIGDA